MWLRAEGLSRIFSGLILAASSVLVFLSTSVKAEIWEDREWFAGDVFEAEESFSLRIKGDVHLPQFSLFLVNAEEPDERLELNWQVPRLRDWQLLTFSVPVGWQGRRVYWEATRPIHLSAIAIEGPISPEDILWVVEGRESLSRGTSFLTELLLWGVLLLLPGLAFWILLRPRLAGAVPYFLLWVFAASGAAALLTFSLSAFFPLGGRLLIPALWAFVIAVICLHRRSREALSLIAQPGNLIPLALWWLAALSVTGLGFFQNWQLPWHEAAQARFAMHLPPDNTLPMILGEMQFHSLPRQPFFDEWLSSDRPPLQSGFLLLLSPFFVSGWDQGAQAAGILLQAMVIPLALLSFRLLGLSLVLSYGGILILFGSSVFLLNSVYVWPKLLPAAMLFGLIGIAFRAGGRFQRIDYPFSGALVGLFAVLALLGHGGSLFPLLGLVLICLLFIRFPGWRPALIAPLVLLVFYLPWVGYQKLLDPPGDRILQWHLAGVTEDSGEGLGTVLKQAYADLTLTEWLQVRRTNIQTLMGDWSGFERWIGEGMAGLSWNLQVQSFLAQFFALGVLNLGWFAAVSPLTWKTPRPAREKDYVLRLSGLLFLLAGLLSTLIWVVLIYIPGQTILYHGSYFQPLALSLGLFLALAATSQRLAVIVLAVHLAVSAAVWVRPPLAWLQHDTLLFGFPSVNPLMVITALTATGFLFAGFLLTLFIEKKARPSP